MDLTSSWVSHLPDEVYHERIVGRRMKKGLNRNPGFDKYVVQNLNTEPRPASGDAELDSVDCCVSIDCLTRPVKILCEVGRVLKASSPAIISFSNLRLTIQAVPIWHQLEKKGYMRLVEECLREIDNFENVCGLDRSSQRMFSAPLYAVIGWSTSLLCKPRPR